MDLKGKKDKIMKIIKKYTKNKLINANLVENELNDFFKWLEKREKIKMEVSEFTLIFAFRYAIGRASTAPSIVVRDLINNWDNLTSFTKEQIKEDIKEAIENNNAGWKCDIEEWKKILELKG